MAHLTQRRPENVAGDLYVDRTCIDCDTCRWMAPAVFRREGEQSAVFHQPAGSAERLSALQALLACPTASIGTVNKPSDIQAAQSSFPIPITETVYHCGYHAESAYGAASYLIQRREGNILVDSPRFAPPLVKRLEAMGGVRYLYLTHRDDVADHQKYHDHFGCDRILHADDITENTRCIETPLSGTDPISLAPDLTILPVPGHTQGHTVLLYRNQVLFSGDHLAWSEQMQQLIAFRRACWYSWPMLLNSMKTLLNYSFEWVLPGHGRRYHASAAAMQQALQACIAWMERTP
ncbi:MBL fold metallo-hydrolase [Synechococcales cyanobacterium C]|uniref:MBL fold metallo-hydrolase n=1 Tax=Petrachloros mirabilis ULC683 TaxID=2781853 RepID=A0A8K2A8E7_9CYAN|nr:MBL fold metallo-hydrolase [Petrachloros mirabilis]NCJ06890.1 MBL fold metallo-hydrolase [Petrachloros mirabilis ULC683]